MKDEKPEERRKILDYAKKKYLAEGFYKTSMDTIASELQISKKTIYKYFPSKEDLVLQISEDIKDYAQTEIGRIINSDSNAIVKIGNLLDLLSTFFISFTDKWLNDLKLHSNLWERIDEFRTKKIYNTLNIILEQGYKEGLFLDYPNEIVGTIFMSSIRAIVNPDFLYVSKFSYQEAISITFEILFNGILTEKGKELLNKKLKRV